MPRAQWGCATLPLSDRDGGVPCPNSISVPTLFCSSSLTSSSHSQVGPFVLGQGMAHHYCSRSPNITRWVALPSALAVCSQTGFPRFLCSTVRAVEGAAAPAYMPSWPEVTMLPFEYWPRSCGFRSGILTIAHGKRFHRSQCILRVLTWACRSGVWWSLSV